MAPRPPVDLAPQAPPPGAPAPRFGAPRDAGVPLLETVRITAPDLARRAALEKSRSRLVLAALGFAVLFLAVAGKLAIATIIAPLAPPPLPPRLAEASLTAPAMPVAATTPTRAMITDRNGEILAVSLPTSALFANPREMIDPADAARRLKQALPRLDEAMVGARLASGRQFVYLERQITPREQLAVNRLGIPGVYFQPSDRRYYPQGRAAAHVLGGVDVDGRGIAGVERFFDQRLRDDPSPLRLSLDLRVQAVVHDELDRAIQDFNAIGGCGIVLDVRTGEVLAMVSLPDYDANDAAAATPEQRFNRAVTGMYEPGSTFKLQTVSMALESGLVNIWNGFDASRPIRAGRFTINDFEGKKRWLYVPEIIAYSSNIGAARMAVFVGAERQRAWLRQMGMLSRVGIQLPEAGAPLYPPVSNWKEIATMTIAFGQGIAVSPLHIGMGTAAVADGGILRAPTLLADTDATPPRPGVRVMSQATSDIVRKLMRVVVTDGFGKAAEVPGYYVGGKTGTAQKKGHRGYKKDARVDGFTSVFPMQAPRYAVYMMVDEPKANATTHGYATAGWVIAPAVGKVIARIGPMLGLLPDVNDAAAINQALFIPLQPGRPAGAKAGPNAPGGGAQTPRTAPPVAASRPRDVRPAAPMRPADTLPADTLPADPLPMRPLPVLPPPMRDLRHEAALLVPAAGAAGRAN